MYVTAFVLQRRKCFSDENCNKGGYSMFSSCNKDHGNCDATLVHAEGSAPPCVHPRGILSG